MSTERTETLADAMIEALHTEAAAAGDYDTVYCCEIALDSDSPTAPDCARRECAAAISDARAMDDDRPYVEVVA